MKNRTERKTEGSITHQFPTSYILVHWSEPYTWKFDSLLSTLSDTAFDHKSQTFHSCKFVAFRGKCATDFGKPESMIP